MWIKENALSLVVRHRPLHRRQARLRLGAVRRATAAGMPTCRSTRTRAAWAWWASARTPPVPAPITPAVGALIFGHELTHDYNIYHTNTSDACGSNDSNSNFPYSNSSIQAFGFNPITGKIYDPSLTHDLMSYCPSGGSKQGWIAPFTWSTMYSRFTHLAASPGQNGPSLVHPQQTNVLLPTSFTQSLVVNATI